MSSNTTLLRVARKNLAEIERIAQKYPEGSVLRAVWEKKVRDQKAKINRIGG